MYKMRNFKYNDYFYMSESKKKKNATLVMFSVDNLLLERHTFFS